MSSLSSLSGASSSSSDVDITPSPFFISLAAWNQAARREFRSVCVCFPTSPEATHKNVQASLRSALNRLGKQRPDFAGTLQVNNVSGKVCLVAPDDSIPLRTIGSDSTTRSYSYRELQEHHFPLGFFESLATDTKGFEKEQDTERFSRAQVSYVETTFISGGLLLWVHLNKVVADATCMQMFMECFAAQTRKTMFSCPSSQALDETRISKRVVDNKPTLGDLLTACPEFVLQWDPLGPATTNPSPPAGQNPGPDGDLFLGEVSEVTFLTSWAKLQELRRLVATRGTCRGSPSETDCFTALIWAHATMARMRVRSPGDGIRFSPGTEARLLAPVNWRGHAFNHETRNFFGNTTAYPVTRVPLKEVVDAAEDMDLLAHLASSISAMAEAVDEDFVATQTALMRACPDIRHLGTNICLENPTGFSVDSWRSIGEGLSWGISGILTSKADVVRPVHATNGDGTALILPTTDLSDYHVSVTLQPQAMEVLCNNPGWRQWFHGVIR